MSVAELLELVTPPDNPLYSGNDQAWKVFENEFPFPLPMDFREYLETFGLGDLGDMFYVFSPFDPDPDSNFLNRYAELDQMFIDVCEDEGWMNGARENQLPGLILFGGDTNGNYLHWLTDGEPDIWPIVVGGGRDPSVSKHKGPFTSFFAAVLRHETATDRYSPNIVKQTFRNYPNR